MRQWRSQPRCALFYQVAIVVSKGDTVPAIFCEETLAALLARLNTLKAAPSMSGVGEARKWLAPLPAPSGWFLSMDEAHAFVDRMKRSQDVTATEVQNARELLGLSRAAFATRIGFGGNDNTRHKTIFEIENGKKRLNSERTRELRAVLAEFALISPKDGELDS